MRPVHARRGRLAALALLAGCCLALASGPAGSLQHLGSPHLTADTDYVGRLPGYEPKRRVSGTIRIWGHGSFRRNFMGKLFETWQHDFKKFHPDIELENRMYGTASAVGALYSGAGDIAILGEEIHPKAAAVYEQVMGCPPFQIDVATGSLDVRNFDYAHVFFVHKDNPLDKLTLQELDAVFGAEHRRGKNNIRTWGGLGLRGPWATKRIRPYGWKLDDDFALYLQATLLKGSHRWNNDIVEFGHVNRPDGTTYDHGQQILDALARDPYGIAVSSHYYKNDGVKALALALDAAGPFVKATRVTLIDRTYPFTRIIPAIVNKPPGGTLDAKVAEFLRYLLSREGQQALLSENGYLPLSQKALAEQLKKVE